MHGLARWLADLAFSEETEPCSVETGYGTSFRFGKPGDGGSWAVARRRDADRGRRPAEAGRCPAEEATLAGRGRCGVRCVRRQRARCGHSRAGLGGRRRHDLPALPDTSRPDRRRLPAPNRGPARSRPCAAGGARQTAPCAGRWIGMFRRLSGHQAGLGKCTVRRAPFQTTPRPFIDRLAPRVRALLEAAAAAGRYARLMPYELLRGVGISASGGQRPSLQPATCRASHSGTAHPVGDQHWRQLPGHHQGRECRSDEREPAGFRVSCDPVSPLSAAPRWLVRTPGSPIEFKDRAGWRPPTHPRFANIPMPIGLLAAAAGGAAAPRRHSSCPPGAFSYAGEQSGASALRPCCDSMSSVELCGCAGRSNRHPFGSWLFCLMMAGSTGTDWAISTGSGSRRHRGLLPVQHGRPLGGGQDLRSARCSYGRWSSARRRKSNPSPSWRSGYPGRR